MTTAHNLKAMIRAYGEGMRTTPPGDIREELEARALAEIDGVIDAVCAYLPENTPTLEELGSDAFCEQPPPRTGLSPEQQDALLDDYARHPPSTPRPVPEYPHTCKVCQFLGRYTPTTTPDAVDAVGRAVSRQFYARADLYICCPHLRGSQKIVSRYGPNPGDTASMSVEVLRGSFRVRGCDPARAWPAHVEALRLYDAQVQAIETGVRSISD